MENSCAISGSRKRPGRRVTGITLRPLARTRNNPQRDDQHIIQQAAGQYLITEIYNIYIFTITETMTTKITLIMVYNVKFILLGRSNEQFLIVLIAAINPFIFLLIFFSRINRVLTHTMCIDT